MDDLAEVLPAADVLLLPSLHESFGLVALEAMACGVPVVGARAGGLPEVVRDGTDGILEAVGDVEAMGRRLSALLADRQEHARLRQNARRRSEEHFRTDQVVPLYEDLYREVLSR